MLKNIKYLTGFLIAGLLFSLVACSGDTTSTSTSTSTPIPVPTSDPTTSGATLYTFSNTSPHITKIDAETNTVLQTADIPDLVRLAWNDDGNYFDGTDLWLAARDNVLKTSELIFLNLEALSVSGRLDLGSNPANVYLGVGNLKDGLTSDGEVWVALQGNMDQAGELVIVDPKTREIIDRVVDSVNQIACDIGVAVGPDGVERVFVPNQKMDAVQNFDAKSRALITTVTQPEGSMPFMLTTAPDGKSVWVQDGKAGTNSVLDAVTLETIKRIPTGAGPVVASFSPDGKYGYVGHSKSSFVTVVDTQTLEIITNVEVGSSPSKLAAHPNGKYLYAIVTKENAVAVINTNTWAVESKIQLDSSPGGIYIVTKSE